MALILLISGGAGSMTAMASSGSVRLEVDMGEIVSALAQDGTATDTYRANGTPVTDAGEQPKPTNADVQSFYESLYMPYEQEGSTLARHQLMEALEGKRLVKTLLTDRVQALVAVDMTALRLEVIAVNTGDHPVAVELVVNDRQGRRMNPGQVAAHIYTADIEHLTEQELEDYRGADGVSVEILDAAEIVVPAGADGDGPVAVDDEAQSSATETFFPQDLELLDEQSSDADDGQTEQLSSSGAEADDGSTEADTQKEPAEDTDDPSKSGGVPSLLSSVRVPLLRIGGGVQSGESEHLQDEFAISTMGAEESVETMETVYTAVVERETAARATVRGDTVSLRLPAHTWAQLTTGFPLEMDAPNGECTVTYDLGAAEGEAPVDDKRYLPGTSAQVLHPPKTLTPPAGKVFVGWQIAGTTETHYPFNRIPLQGSVTLVAKYVNYDEVAILTYFANGGNGDSISIAAELDETVPLMGLDIYDRAGYYQAGWATESDAIAADSLQNDSILMDHDKHLYAVWEPGMNTVQFTAAPGGSLTGETHISVQFGTQWSEIAVPVPNADEGYWFMGWSPGFPDDHDGVMGDLTFQAIFGKQQPLTITAQSGMWTYNGREHSIDGYSTDLPDGYQVTGLTVAGKGTESGTYPVTPQIDTQQYSILNEWGFPVTDCFSIPNLVPGQLEIAPATLTITADDLTIPAGSPPPSYSLDYSGFVNGEGPEVLETLPDIHCDYTPDAPARSYDITPSGAQARNYEITYKAGELTVVDDDDGNGDGGGNNGGSSGGGGGGTERIPGSRIRIPDQPIPLMLTTILEEETPLLPLFIPSDDPAPMGDLPSAGGIPVELAIPLGALLVCADGVYKLRGRRKQQQAGGEPEDARN